MYCTMKTKEPCCRPGQLSAVFVMISDGAAIRYHEFIPEVWKQSRIDNAPIEAQSIPRFLRSRSRHLAHVRIR